MLLAVPRRPSACIQVVDVVLTKLAHTAEEPRVVRAESSHLARGWKITDQGDEDASDESSCRILRSAREEDAAFPEDQQFVGEGLEEVVDLIDRRLMGTRDNTDQVHIFREITQMGREVETHHVDACDRHVLLRLLGLERVERVDGKPEDVTSFALGSMHEWFTVLEDFSEHRRVPKVRHDALRRPSSALCSRVHDLLQSMPREKSSQPVLQLLVKIHPHGNVESPAVNSACSP